MLDKIKRKMLRKKLEKEKMRLLSEFLAVKKRIKKLDELNELNKKKAEAKRSGKKDVQ